METASGNFGTTAHGTTLENLRHSIEALPFHFLKKVDPQNLLTFILDEHPQTIALILSHLPPPIGAEVVKGLPADRQLAVYTQSLAAGASPESAIRAVVDHLVSETVAGL